MILEYLKMYLQISISKNKTKKQSVYSCTKVFFTRMFLIGKYFSCIFYSIKPNKHPGRQKILSSRILYMIDQTETAESMPNNSWWRNMLSVFVNWINSKISPTPLNGDMRCQRRKELTIYYIMLASCRPEWTIVVVDGLLVAVFLKGYCVVSSTVSSCCRIYRG